MNEYEYLQQSYDQTSAVITKLHLEVQLNQCSWDLSEAQIGSVYTFYTDFDDAARRLRKTISQLSNAQCKTQEHRNTLTVLVVKLKELLREFKSIAETVDKNSREHELRPFAQRCLELYAESQKLPGKVKAPVVEFSQRKPKNEKSISVKSRQEASKPAPAKAHFHAVQTQLQAVQQKATSVLAHADNYPTEHVYYAEQVQQKYVPEAYKQMQLLSLASESVRNAAEKLFERQVNAMNAELDRLKEHQIQENISPIKTQANFLKEKYRHWLDGDTLELS